MGGDELGLLPPPPGRAQARPECRLLRGRVGEGGSSKFGVCGTPHPVPPPQVGREPCGAPAHIAKGASAVDLPTMHEYREERRSRTSLRHRQLFERRIHYRLTSLTFSMASGVMLNTSATILCISSPV